MPSRAFHLGETLKMLLLSRIAGRDVAAHDGKPVGRVADLKLSLDGNGDRHVVQWVLVRRRQGPQLLVPWESIAAFGPRGIVLDEGDVRRFEIAAVDDALDADEILLVRDVLDTQIVDVAGRRLARVADVVLARTSDRKLELVGVDVGFGGVLRRLGLTALARRTAENAVAWTDLHLLSERGHTVQLASPRSAVHHLNARGLAELVGRVDTTSAVEILTARQPALAADAISASVPAIGERVLRAMPEAQASRIVAAMPADHADRWRGRLAHRPALRGRRFIRSRAWPARRRVRGEATSRHGVT